MEHNLYEKMTVEDKFEFESIIIELKKKAHNSWLGQIGYERGEHLENFIRNKTDHYGKFLGYTPLEVLKAWENVRDYSVINFYQECNQPELTQKRVFVFNTKEELHEAVGQQGFRCPKCNQISTNAYACIPKNKKDKVNKCDWKSYGLFGTLNEGATIVIKDPLITPVQIFMPIAFEKDK